jgi:hypothetical protein
MSTGTAVTGRTRVEPGVSTNGAGPQVAPDLVTFPDLVRAHRAWELELYDSAREHREPNRMLEQEYHERWSQFEHKYGQIKNAYWSVRDASAVAFSVKKRRRAVRVWDHEHIPRFHRVTDWATRDEPEVAKALDDCESLAVRVEEILRGPSELIALRRITAVASQLLGYVDRQWGRESPPPAAGLQAPDWVHQAQCKEFVAGETSELADVEEFYKRTGNGQGKILYFWGMVIGLLVLGLVTAGTVATSWPVDNLDGGPTHWAGALGAFLSVLQRMASSDDSKFSYDFEVGRANVRWLGIYRPFVGGIFGAATFLLLGSGILTTDPPGSDKDYAYYGILAFFSGFFERFTKLPTGDLPTVAEEGKTRETGEVEKAERSTKGDSAK